MTPRTARGAAAIATVAAALLTSACFVPPPAPTPGQEPPVATPVTVETGAPTEAEAPVQSEAAPEPMYEIVADGQDGSSWSFQVGEIRVVEGDALGDPPEAGYQLVEVTVDGQLLAGEPDFYHAFHMYLVDANGGEWGLSSGTNHYADGDLFTTGSEPEFSGVGIYHVPAELTFDTVRFTTDGGWSQDVQP